MPCPRFSQGRASTAYSFRTDEGECSSGVFNIDTDQALAILRLLHVEDATTQIDSQPSKLSEQEQEATKAFKNKRPNLDLIAMGIPEDAELRCTRNDMVVRVIGPRKVMLGSDELSLTAAPRIAPQLDYDISPGPFWLYDGRTVSEMYEEFHSA